FDIGAYEMDFSAMAAVNNSGIFRIGGAGNYFSAAAGLTFGAVEVIDIDLYVDGELHCTSLDISSPMSFCNFDTSGLVACTSLTITGASTNAYFYDDLTVTGTMTIDQGATCFVECADFVVGTLSLPMSSSSLIEIYADTTTIAGSVSNVGGNIEFNHTSGGQLVTGAGLAASFWGDLGNYNTFGNLIFEGPLTIQSGKVLDIDPTCVLECRGDLTLTNAALNNSGSIVITTNVNSALYTGMNNMGNITNQTGGLVNVQDHIWPSNNGTWHADNSEWVFHANADFQSAALTTAGTGGFVFAAAGGQSIAFPMATINNVTFDSSGGATVNSAATFSGNFKILNGTDAVFRQDLDMNAVTALPGNNGFIVMSPTSGSVTFTPPAGSPIIHGLTFDPAMGASIGTPSTPAIQVTTLEFQGAGTTQVSSEVIGIGGVECTTTGSASIDRLTFNQSTTHGINGGSGATALKILTTLK
ncbi:MAG: hypothetical protein KDB07_13590, partial [Planctomycetes bacterium]|nr:hypothetical protein [Planctomycetota bacterium]